MQVRDEDLEFGWDKGNLEKSRRKHGVASEEAESVFSDPNLLIIADQKHSEAEERFAIVGKSKEGRSLFIVFTWREKKIRIISARRIHGKEVERDDKAKENS